METYRTEVSKNDINKKELLLKENKYIFELLVNNLILENTKELKTKWYIDFSDKAITEKLKKVFLNLKNDKSIAKKYKHIISSFETNFLSEWSEKIIRFLKEKLILNKNEKITEDNIDIYFNILEKSILSVYDLSKESKQDDIEFYLDNLENLLWNNVLKNFPDLYYIFTDFLPSLSKVLDKSILSKSLDNLFQSEKTDILLVLSWKELSKEKIYQIKLNFIRNLSLFLNQLNSNKVSWIIFEKLPNLSFIKNNKDIYDIFSKLNKINLKNTEKKYIIDYFLDSIHNLSKPFLKNQDLNNFSKQTIDFLNHISKTIPEDTFKKILIDLLHISKWNDLDLKSFISYIKTLDYGEIFELIKANFPKIIDIAKNLLDKWITKISLEDFLLELFKSNILSDISKDLWYKIVEQIRKIANLDIKSILEDTRKKMIGSNLKIEKKIKLWFDTKVSKNIATTFVDWLMEKFKVQIKKEIKIWDERLTKKELIEMLKNQAKTLILQNPKLLLDFIKQSWFDVDEEDIKLIQKIWIKIINNPRFNEIALSFIENMGDIVLKREDIINNLQLIIDDIKKSFPFQIEKNQTNEKIVIADLIYSSDFNKDSIYWVINILEKNGINISDKKQLVNILYILPKYLSKKDFLNIFEDINLFDIKNINQDKLFIKIYKRIRKKTEFLKNLMELWIINSKNNSTLDNEKINFITEIVYSTINSSNEIDVEELIEDYFNKTWNIKLNKIKILDRKISTLIVDELKVLKKRDFKRLLIYINKNILWKKTLSEKDYLNLIDKVLHFTDTSILVKKIKEDWPLSKESLFILKNSSKLARFYDKNKRKLLYLNNNKKEFLKIFSKLKIKNNKEKNLVNYYISNVFDVWHYLVSIFTKKELLSLFKMFNWSNNMPLKWINIKVSNNLSKSTIRKLKRSFIWNNFLFSLKSFFKYGFNMKDMDVIYDYLKDRSNKSNFKQTFISLLEEKRKKSQSPLDILRT